MLQTKLDQNLWRYGKALRVMEKEKIDNGKTCVINSLALSKLIYISSRPDSSSLCSWPMELLCRQKFCWLLYQGHLLHSRHYTSSMKIKAMRHYKNQHTLCVFLLLNQTVMLKWAIINKFQCSTWIKLTWTIF